MIFEYLIGQLFLVLFNIGNAFIDAYRILNNKKIAHAINFAAYLCFSVIVSYPLGICHYSVALMLFFISAFFNRQFSFDIPLNLRRGLAWDYQSQAQPPKAIMDRIERAIFGNELYTGKDIFKAYLVCYCLITCVWVWVVPILKN